MMQARVETQASAYKENTMGSRIAQKGEAKRNIAYTQCFFVQNLSGYCRQTKELWPAVLVIGAHGFGEEADSSIREPRLTCHLMTDGEIDYEIDVMKKQLEQLRRKAKTMLAKHRSDEKLLLAEKRSKKDKGEDSTEAK